MEILNQDKTTAERKAHDSQVNGITSYLFRSMREPKIMVLRVEGMLPLKG